MSMKRKNRPDSPFSTAEDILYTLKSRGPQTMAQLIESTGAHRTTVWNCLDGLVERGEVLYEWRLSQRHADPAVRVYHVPNGLPG